MRVDNVRWDLEFLEGFPIQDINKTAPVNKDRGHHEIFNDDGDKDPRHHEICNDDGDDHGVVLGVGVEALGVHIRKGDRKETSL